MDIADLWLMLAAFVLCRSNRTEHYQQAALYVHMILNGAAPAELPVGRTLSKLDLVIEHRVAKRYGFAVPLSLLARADTCDRVKRKAVKPRQPVPHGPIQEADAAPVSALPRIIR
jgi:hypothetical protein